MDIIDAKILTVLQENSRTSISDLSKTVDLSLSAVSERLKKLENAKIIEKYTVILNNGTLGQELSVVMHLSLDRPIHTAEFLEAVQKEKEILQCHYVTGEFDYILIITTKNTATLEALVTRIKSLPGIMRTQTNVVLSSIKHLHSVSPLGY